MDQTGNLHMELGTGVILESYLFVLLLINLCRINVVLLAVINRWEEKKNLKGKEG